jgi:hypothetical protein
MGLNVWAPASGNWCWIKKSILLRYSLTHGWRILIFLVTVGIYTYIYIYLKRVYGKLHISSSGGSVGTYDNAYASTVDLHSDIVAQQPVATEYPMNSLETTLSEQNKQLTLSTEHVETDSQPMSPRSIKHPQMRLPDGPLSSQTEKNRRRALRKMLLLNGYPVLYVILWVPGIANRLTEIITGEAPLWLTALQASTQLVGFANALTYAWNEQLSHRVRRKLGAGLWGRSSNRDGE